MLAAGVDSLSNKDGSFHTFFFPPECDNENWNFYSGEALLFWPSMMTQGEFAPLMARCTAAFLHYPARHRLSRYPAFVPWHTQACVSLFAQTAWREPAEFALEMCDWLLPMQQMGWLTGGFAGAFLRTFTPGIRSSPCGIHGVYLEELTDALTLVRKLGDTARTIAYSQAINRGLCSLRQL